MKRHPKFERTVLLLKPDAVARGLVGEILNRVERRGLKIVALAMERPARKKVDDHYPKDRKWIARLGEKTFKTYHEYGYDVLKELGTNNTYRIGLQVRSWLVGYMASGPIVKVVIEGVHAIAMVRKLAGHTMPAQAEMGTIRGDYSVDSAAAANRDKRSVKNLVHASETPAESKHELRHWFSQSELHAYTRSEHEAMF